LDNESEENIKNTPEGEFLRIDDFSELETTISKFIEEEREFFSSMLPKKKLGKLIEIASKEPTYVKKAEKFLELLRGV